MEVYIPVRQDFGGFGPWEHRGGASFANPEYWLGGHCRGGFGRPLNRRGTCPGRRGGQQPMTSRHPRLAFDDMDMDNWMSPADVLATFLVTPARPQQTNAAGTSASAGATNGTTVTNTNNNHFEVKVNVADYKPETLSVKVENGVITIEGKFEETKTNRDESGNKVVSEEFVARSFRRSYTIPPNAIEEKLECKMTADGHLVLSAPLKSIEPPQQPATRSIPITTASTEEDKDVATSPAANPEPMTTESESVPNEPEKNN